MSKYSRIQIGRRVKSANYLNCWCDAALAIGPIFHGLSAHVRQPNAKSIINSTISMGFFWKHVVWQSTHTPESQRRFCIDRISWNRRDIIPKLCRANSWPAIGMRAVISIHRSTIRPKVLLPIWKRPPNGATTFKISAKSWIQHLVAFTIIDCGKRNKIKTFECFLD